MCVKKGSGVVELDTDFTFDFSDADNPGVTFVISGHNWYVWAHQAGDVDAPANLGVLKLSDGVSTESFKRHIWNEDGSECTEQSTCPGAVDIGSVCLDAESRSGAEEWTGHSSIAEGSQISGNLESMILVKDSSGGSAGLTSQAST